MDAVIVKTQFEAKRAVKNLGRNLPNQEKEEIIQKTVLKFIEKYKAGEIKEEENWEGLIATSVRGYVRNHKRDRRNERALLPTGFDDFSIEDLCDERSDRETRVAEAAFSYPINWDLLARLCRADKELKVFVLFNIFGYTLVEINELFGRSSEKRIADLNYDFLARMMPVGPENAYLAEDWTRQVLYALGLTRLYGLKHEDLGIGWKLDPVEFGRPPEVDRLGQECFNFEEVG
ncbi:sigma-70 family RNA polymerase sigma factor [Bdellovibrio bacteriovorus]|uniref:sigma-70 family RNA polymerase sigma factor n=1 Tax=Bdellovibrio bacteriovorus TaxID=959 RepID=UPI0011862FDA|nr:sigma-70 family RNA polymerase sigma factor [Bdellovibrio bacteriovorus]